MKKEKRYRITMTESQLRLMIDAVEDWHRFLAGQCEMSNATSLLMNTDHMRAAQHSLMAFVRPHIVPELQHPGASYGWSGHGCPNEFQRKAIAMSYMLYREPLHFLTVKNDRDNVYTSETLTCPEQGPMIKIEEVET